MAGVPRERWSFVARPSAPEEPARHVAELSDIVGSDALRVNVWRYEPGAVGVRHRHLVQEELFLVLEGALTIYLGEPPDRHDVAAGGIVHVPAGTPLQSANHGDVDLVVYAVGTPPEESGSERLPSAL